MTKTTEDLKHELFDLLAMVKNQTANTVTMGIFEESLEAYLERLRNEAESAAARLAYVLKDSEILRDAYSHQQGLTHAACVEAREGWNETYELKGQVRELQSANENGCRVLMNLREERDEMRNRLQAFEFANKSAGEFLIESQELVKQYRETNKRQRQSIGQLKNERDNALHTVKVRTSQRDGLEAQLLEARKELSELRKSVGSTSAQIEAENVAIDECGAIPTVNQVRFVQGFVAKWDEAVSMVCNHRFVEHPFGTTACIDCKKVYKWNETK